MTDEKLILDMTCGGRSIWFIKQHPNAIYFDQRVEDFKSNFGKDHTSERVISVHPDVVGDFRHLPFPDNPFHIVVFDPPHIVRDKPNNGWITKKYGQYLSTEEALSSVSQGLREGMRVLKPYGTLVFKWAETSIPTRDILDRFGQEPLFGHRSGKKMGTHWLCFMKIPKDGEQLSLFDEP